MSLQPAKSLAPLPPPPPIFWTSPLPQCSKPSYAYVNHNIRLLLLVRSLSYFPVAAWIFLRTISFVKWSLYEIFLSYWTFDSISSQRPTSVSLALVSRSINHKRTEIWDSQRSELVSPLIQEIYCNLSILESAFVRAAVACAILERTSAVEPSSETTAQLPFNFDFPLDAIGAVCY